MKYAIAVDVGGTNVKYAFVNSKGRVVKFATLKTETLNDFEELLDIILESYEKFISTEKVTRKSFAGMGLGFPGPIDRNKGVIIRATNIKNWSDIHASDLVKKKFKLPLHMENDANLAGLGEYWRGNGKGYNHILMLTLGTGVGGALIFNGKIYNGSRGYAPELGHITIDRKGPKCNCGNRGCLECYVSKIGIRRLLSRELPKFDSGKFIDKVNGDISKFSPRMLYELAEGNDELALRILNKVGKYLGIGVASLVNIFNPDIVIIGGGIINAKKYLFPVVKRMVKERAFDVMTGDLVIRNARHSEKAGIYGGAKLVFDNGK